MLYFGDQSANDNSLLEESLAESNTRPLEDILGLPAGTGKYVG